MSASRKRLPRLCIHKATQQYYVRIDGKQVYLGSVEGPDAEAKAEAERLAVLSRWQQSGQKTKEKKPVIGPPSLNVLMARYVAWVNQRYRKPDGRPTSEQEGIRRALSVLQRLYGSMRGEDFSPLELQTVQAAMASGSWMNAQEQEKAQKGNWCRNVCNQMTGRLRRFFKWCVAQKLLHVTVYQALMTVPDLRRGQLAGDTVPRETKRVPPAPESAIQAVLKAVTAPIAAMIELQLLTGMRPGEVCALRPGDIDKTGEALAELIGDRVALAGVWAYLPPDHKTAHHDTPRIIPIGPKAQALLAPWLKGLGRTMHVFSPARWQRVRFDLMRAARKSKVQPSQVCRAKVCPTRRPGKRYDTSAYSHAINKACKRLGVPLWHPHQLRHNAATRLKAEFGWDVARLVLGHSSIDATKIYVADDLKKAFEAIGKIG